jgi:phosphatidate cytidylyltransferase
MAPIGLFVVFAGRIATIAGVVLLAAFAFREFARVSGLNRDRWMSAAIYAAILAIGIASALNRYRILIAILPAAITLILCIPILQNRFRGELERVALAVVGFVYIAWMFGHLGFLANARNAYGLVCFIIFATALCDVAAFTFGKIFGRHPLRSEISPNKTWEGAIGAFAVAMILPWLLRFSFPFFGPRELILAGLIVGIGGQLGDLSISVIKRDIGTKDMAASIPGHGGILDRIDSLIYAAPLFMHMAGYYHPLR